MGLSNTKEINSDTFSNENQKSAPDYALLVSDSKSYLEIKVSIRRFFTGAIVQQKKCISGPPEQMKEFFNQLKNGDLSKISNPLNFDCSDQRDEVLNIVNVKLYSVNGIDSF